MKNLSEPARVFLISFLILVVGLGALNYIEARKEHVRVQHIEHVIKTIQGQITLKPCLHENIKNECKSFVAQVSQKVINEILRSPSLKLVAGHSKLTLKKTPSLRQRKEVSGNHPQIQNEQQSGHG